MKKPQQYQHTRYRLDLWSGFGLIISLPILWWQTHWWTVVIWVAIYMAAELYISDLGEKRFIADHVELWRRIRPDAATDDWLSDAKASLEREKQANLLTREYL